MPRHRHLQTWISGLLLAGFMLAAVAPAAEARRHESRRYKAPKRVHVVHHARHAHRPPVRVVEIHRSSELPALAGFLGGLVVGAVISQATSVHDDCAVAPEYDYYDPYCRVRFVSLEAYRGHLYRHGHPGIARVIELRTGECVHVYRYQRGAWEDWDESWD